MLHVHLLYRLTTLGVQFLGNRHGRPPARPRKLLKHRASAQRNLWRLACICGVMQRSLVVLAFAAGMAWGQSATPPGRHITFNGKPLTAEQQKRLEAVEREHGVRLPDRDYWYDNRSGAAGLWQGPALGALPAGLELGGPMPAQCSGRGTGVFVNGRELHPADVLTLTQFTLVAPGRYWADAEGNFGFEGGPALVNLLVLARASHQQQRRVYAPGEIAGLVGSAGR